MRPALIQTLRSRSFGSLVHLGLWLLLYLAVAGLGGKAPGLREVHSTDAPTPNLLPAARLQRLFAPDVWPAFPAQTNTLNPFFTRYFIPVQQPPAPPPTTRDIELTYLGFFQVADGPKYAMVKMGEAFLVAQIGSNLTANLFAARASATNLTLTNLTAQTNLLQLNTTNQLKVPIR